MKRELALIALFLLVLSGCTGIQFGKTKEQAAALTEAHTGVKGVTMDFVTNNPPDIVFTGNPLDVVVEIKNEGAATASGTLYLSGYDSRLFNILPKDKTFSLEGRTSFNTFGGYDSVDFSSGPISLPPGTETLPQTFLASVCYGYVTQARIPVCVDPNPNAILENKACKVANPAVAGGQGGPVSVSAIQENAAPGQVSFLLTIANLGDGFVVDTGSLSKCPSPLGFNDVDVLTYAVRLSGQDGNCNPVGKARLSNKQGTIYCTFKLADSTSPAYTSVLEVDLNYAYLSQISKTVNIKNLG